MEEIILGETNDLFTAISHIYRLFKERGWCTEQEAKRAAWDFLESVSEDTLSVKLTGIRSILFPQSQSVADVKVSAGAFQLIVEEAERLYDTHKDATDQERSYWRLLSKGVVPKGMTITNE